MKWNDWLEKWGMTSLKIKTPFLEMDWQPQDEDKSAAWELYIELLTRIATQYLPIEHGDEATTLESIHKLFALTREVIKRQGRHCITFTKIAIIILNQKIRPFTAKWHKEMLSNAFDVPCKCNKFRKELAELQDVLRNYTKMLSDMAGVEDLTELEEN
ncbi:MAG: hypothetical protein HQ543_05470 [Bacteroidetes bacterium]|nr:hypothetical protein [Bacteroidota bacterium]